MSRPVDKDMVALVRMVLSGRYHAWPKGSTAERRSRAWRQMRRHAVAANRQRLLEPRILDAYIELEDGRVKRVSFADYAFWRLSHEDPHVAEDYVGRYRVSTVFLGIDHGYGGIPVLYETMVFTMGIGATVDGGQARYTTRQEALFGHERMLRWVKALDASYEDEVAHGPVD